MIKTGGPEFPNDCHPSNDPDGSLGFRGMTLRDYFAAYAMQGMCSVTGWTDLKAISKISYELADDMLAEREK